MDPMESDELTKLMDFIIKQGVDPNKDNAKPLLIAIGSGSIECARKMLQIGADLVKNGTHVLVSALLSSFRVSMVKYLYEETDLAFKLTDQDKTVVFISIMNIKNKKFENKDAMALFCQRERDFVTTNFHQLMQSVLLIATDLESVQYTLDLLDVYCFPEALLRNLVMDEDIERLKVCVKTDEVGTVLNTIFKISVMEGKASIVQVCLELGVDVSSVVNRNILHLALYKNHLECAQLVAEQMTQSDKNKFLLQTILTEDLDKVRCAIACGANCKETLGLKPGSKLRPSLRSDFDTLNLNQIWLRKLIMNSPPLCHYLESLID